jgi:hypothetical protein
MRRLLYSTFEVRWFFAGPAEAGVEDWFRGRLLDGSGHGSPITWQPEPPAWRRDRYLRIPAAADMGIKWREGRLEIKGREATLGCHIFGPEIEGVVERWLKWSFGGELIERRYSALFADGAGVITVDKRRLQRHVRVEPSGRAVEVGPSHDRERGVDVELTDVHVAGSSAEAHWSMAFEAFPADPPMTIHLSSFVSCFLQECPVLPLVAARSMSYPQWLMQFDEDAAH